MLRFRQFIKEYFGNDIVKAIKYKGKVYHYPKEPFTQHADILKRMVQDKVATEADIDRLAPAGHVEFGYYHPVNKKFAHFASEL